MNPPVAPTAGASAADPSMGTAAPTAEQQAIIRQVEHYFSDDNLKDDAHMLGLMGGAENRPVSISAITGFRKMRQYKPPRKVREALVFSTQLELADRKRVRRRVPYTGPMNVTPKVNEAHFGASEPVRAGQPIIDRARPWVSKGMMKPTGFETYFTDGPISPEEYSEERELYDSDNLFEARIEYAISRFCSRRKFHQDHQRLFDAFMTYGGIDTKPRQFTGGLSPEEMENMDAAAIAAAKATRFVASHVDGSDQWTVDFAAVARGFLCTDKIMELTDPSPERPCSRAAIIVGNFYRYLLQHDVCPEYNDQIKEAISICQTAQTELDLAYNTWCALPDDYSRAMSIMSGGHFSRLAGLGQGDELAPERQRALESLENAFMNLKVEDHGISAIEGDVRITSERSVRLQITAIKLPDTAATSARFGTITCREMNDMYTELLDTEPFVLCLHEEALSQCLVGMKMYICLCENNIGAKWIERIFSVNPGYHEVINNDFWEKEDTEFLGKDWFKRERTIMAKGYVVQKGEGAEGEGNVDEAHDDAEEHGAEEHEEHVDEEANTTA